jgi:ribosomal protein S18 acetylase RimI-like enzyme
MPSPESRLATAADVDRIAEIHVASWRDAYRGLVPDEALEDRTIEKRITQWKGWLEDPELAGFQLFVIEEAGIKGFAFAGPSDDQDLDPSTTVNVGALYLDPAARGAGLGRTLLDYVLSDFAARGFKLATLYVLIGNDPAKRFYARLGWIEEPDVIKECLGDGTPAPQVRFRKALQGSSGTR